MFSAFGTVYVNARELSKEEKIAIDIKNRMNNTQLKKLTIIVAI